jgi:hypothetical protein
LEKVPEALSTSGPLQSVLLTFFTWEIWKLSFCQRLRALQVKVWNGDFLFKNLD